MKFELINQSDKIFFDADSVFIAAIVCALQGGQVSANEVDGEGKTPFFMFGGLDEYLKRHGFEADTVVEKNAQKVIDALKSFRLAYDERTSVVNLCGWAHKLSETLEKKYLLVNPTKSF